MSWSPSSVISESWGRLQVVVNGIDVTYFRDVPTRVVSLTYAEPFGDATAVVEFPQITPYDSLGQGDLSWLVEWADIDINLIRPDTSVHTLWEGMVASDEDSLTDTDYNLQQVCQGAMFQLDRYVRAPLHLAKEVNVTTLLNGQFSHSSRPALRTAELVIEGEPRSDPNDATTVFKSKRTGSWNRVLTGYIQDELALMVTNEDYPRQWTLHLDRPRTPVLRLKTYNAITHNISMGTPGVSHSLTHDRTQEANVIYGEGTDQAGTMWRNSRRNPNITVYDPLAYDERVHTGVDIDGNEINPGARDDSIVRSEVHYGYGAGVDLTKGIKSAEAQLRRDKDSGYIGTITLQSDPEGGSRFEILAKHNILYRHFRPMPWDVDRDIRHQNSERIIDINGRVYDTTTKDYMGMLFHISGVSMDFDALTVTLTVDTKARDLLSLAELIDRINEGHLDPAKRLRLGQSDVVKDEKQPWDYYSGSGYIPTPSLDGDGLLNGSPSPTAEPDQYIFVPGGTWVVTPIRTADKASIMRTEVRAFDASGTRLEVPFHVSVYEHSKVPQDFPADPFAEGIWTPSLDNALAGPPSGYVVGWGQFNQRAGFWPGLDSEGDPATGVLVDEGTWQFELDAQLIEPGIWVAIWCASDAYFQGRFMQGVE